MAWLCFSSVREGNFAVTQLRQGGVSTSEQNLFCLLLQVLPQQQRSTVSGVGAQRFTVVQSCTKPCQATPSVQGAHLTRENPQLGETFQWFNPFPRVVFAGLTST